MCLTVTFAVRGDNSQIVCERTLAYKYRCDPISPSFLDRGENAEFVINQDIVQGGIALLDIIQRRFLADINKDMAVDRFPDARPLPRLEDHVAVGQNYGLSPGA